MIAWLLFDKKPGRMCVSQRKGHLLCSSLVRIQLYYCLTLRLSKRTIRIDLFHKRTNLRLAQTGQNSSQSARQRGGAARGGGGGAARGATVKVPAGSRQHQSIAYSCQHLLPAAQDWSGSQLKPLPQRGTNDFPGCICDVGAFMICPGYTRESLRGLRSCYWPCTNTEAAAKHAKLVLRKLRPDDLEERIAALAFRKIPGRAAVSFHWRGLSIQRSRRKSFLCASTYQMPFLTQTMEWARITSWLHFAAQRLVLRLPQKLTSLTPGYQLAAGLHTNVQWKSGARAL
eukprot:6175062-Pleurochrysis_carterae.AAC.2